MVLMQGNAEHKNDDSEEEKQRQNRLANSALYGYLLESLTPTAPDLAAEIQETFVDSAGYADGFEAIKHLKTRVLVDSYHRNDAIEAQIHKLLMNRVPSGCTRDVWRSKVKELRELNDQLISGKREGEALSAAYFKLLPTSITELKHSVERELRNKRVDPSDPDSPAVITRPTMVALELERLIERINLDNAAKDEHNAYMALHRAMLAKEAGKPATKEGPGGKKGEPRPKVRCEICNMVGHTKDKCFKNPQVTLPDWLNKPEHKERLASIMRARAAAPALKHKKALVSLHEEAPESAEQEDKPEPRKAEQAMDDPFIAARASVSGLDVSVFRSREKAQGPPLSLSRAGPVPAAAERKEKNGKEKSTAAERKEKNGKEKNKEGQRDSNPRPPAYKASALPIELPARGVERSDMKSDTYTPRTVAGSGRDNPGLGPPDCECSATGFERSIATGSPTPAGTEGYDKGSVKGLERAPPGPPQGSATSVTNAGRRTRRRGPRGRKSLRPGRTPLFERPFNTDEPLPGLDMPSDLELARLTPAYSNLMEVIEARDFRCPGSGTQSFSRYHGPRVLFDRGPYWETHGPALTLAKREMAGRAQWELIGTNMDLVAVPRGNERRLRCAWSKVKQWGAQAQSIRDRKANLEATYRDAAMRRAAETLRDAFSALHLAGTSPRAYPALVAMLAASGDSNGTIVDSGAALDFSPHRADFEDLEDPPPNLRIQCADGLTTPLKVGTWVTRTVDQDGRLVTMRRRNACLVPQFGSALMSVSALIEDGYEVVFGRDPHLLTPEGSRVSLVTTGGVYMLPRVAHAAAGQVGPEPGTDPFEACLENGHGNEPKDQSQVTSCVTRGRQGAQAHLTPALVHSRLGHFHDLAWLAQVVDGLPKGNWALQAPCEICLRANARRMPSNRHVPRPTTPGDASVDFWGPFSPTFHHASRYVIGFIDAHSRYVTIYLVNSREEAPQFVERYLADMRALRVTVRRLHFDNAREFVSERMLKLGRERGFQLTTSCEYEPNQNSLIERTWQTLMATTRAMLLESGLPKSFWGWAMLYASTIFNRTPKRAIEPDVTPYELQTGVRASVSHFRPFGCLAYPRNLRPKPVSGKDKLDPRADAAVHLGYSTSQSGYLVLYPGDRVPIATSQVVFREDVFPTLSMRVPGSTHPAEPPELQAVSSQAPVTPPATPASASPPGAPPRAQRREAPPAAVDSLELVGTRVEVEWPKYGGWFPASVVGFRSTQNGRVHYNLRYDNPGGKWPQRDVDRWHRMDDLNWRRLGGGGHGRAPHATTRSDPDHARDPDHGGEEGTIPTHTASMAVRLDTADEESWTFHDSLREQPYGKAINHDGYRFPYATSALTSEKPQNIFFSLAALDVNTPRTHREAMASPDKAKWLEAEAIELANMERNGVYNLVPNERIPKGANIVKSTWSYKVKLGSAGEIVKYKARLCAQGFTQKDGIDFDRTFSPTMRHSSLRLLIAVAGLHGLHRVATADFTGAYLQTQLPDEERVFMTMPPGYAEYDTQGKPLVCALRRCIYGLKQSGRHWHLLLAKTLRELGFTQLDSDPCLFVMISTMGSTRRRSITMALGLYVDDCLIFYMATDAYSMFLGSLRKKHELTDHADAGYFLGINFSGSGDNLTICQYSYIRKMVGKYLNGSTANCRKWRTPCDENLSRQVYQASCAETKPSPELLHSYQSLVGALLYAASATRPDIAHAVGLLSRAMTFPTQELWQSAVRVLAYLAHTEHLGLTFSKGGEHGSTTPQAKLSGMSDSDWSVRVSTTGVLILLNGIPIHWISKRQACIALSSTEAEIMAASTAGIEVIYHRNVLEELLLEQSSPTPLGVDNSGAVDIAHDPMHRGRTMHIERRHLKIRELVSDGAVKVYKISGDDNLADIFTKALNPRRFELLRSALMTAIEPPKDEGTGGC